MKKLVQFLLPALLFSHAAFSQEKTFPVDGQVIDAKSGQPLNGASVFCQNTTVGTLSKEDGSFHVLRLLQHDVATAAPVAAPEWLILTPLR